VTNTHRQFSIVLREYEWSCGNDNSEQQRGNPRGFHHRFPFGFDASLKVRPRSVQAGPRRDRGVQKDFAARATDIRQSLPPGTPMVGTILLGKLSFYH